MSTSTESSGPGDLSGPLLRALREEAGLSQPRAVALAGVSQAQLSRIERGQVRPSPAATRALAELYASHLQAIPGARTLSRDDVEHLVAQAEALAAEHVDARVVLQAGRAHNFQQRIREAEERATVVRSYHPTTILGVLQTRAFAGAWFEPDDVLTPADAAASIDERMLRGEALARPGREWHLVQTEQALRWPVRDYSLQADQLDQMVAASRLPNVSLRLIRLDTLAAAPAPLTGFHLYDDRELVVGTDLGTALVSDERRVRDYRSRFAAVEALALDEDDSRELLLSLSRDYRARA